MSILECVLSAIKSVFGNKMRALLTMLGIIIGIGSVIIITSIGEGSQAQIRKQFEQMGIGRLTVSLRGGRNISERDFLTIKDYELLRDNTDEGLGMQLKYSAATNNSYLNLKLLDPKTTKQASVQGVYGDYYEIMNPTLLYGRYISESDNEMGSKVAVINDTTAVKVFGESSEDIIGRKIELRTYRGIQNYLVIGILENKNAAIENMYGDQFPENIVVPLVTLQRLSGTKRVNQLTLVVKDTDVIDSVASEITNALDEYHGTTEKYYVQNTMQIMDQINSVTGMMTAFISAVAGISLLVGGIGVMNIMLVTVTERTREIGIRKSIGAKKRDILIQFLVESIILTSMGGFLGIMLGWGGGGFVGTMVNITPIISMQSVIIAVSISTVIGIVFGVYPANKAAKLDPIEALRYE